MDLIASLESWPTFLLSVFIYRAKGTHNSACRTGDDSSQNASFDYTGSANRCTNPIMLTDNDGRIAAICRQISCWQNAGAILGCGKFTNQLFHGIIQFLDSLISFLHRFVQNDLVFFDVIQFADDGFQFFIDEI